MGASSSAGSVVKLLLECLALDVLHDDDVLVVVADNFIDVTDEGMIQSGNRDGLPQKALAGEFIVGLSGGQELQRHFARQGGVFGQVDFPHPSFADLLDDPVM